MKLPSMDQLLEEGRLELVPADSRAALSMLREARLHLLSAGRIMEQDCAGAYSLLYDAARKAVSAHMLTRGYRAAPNRPGAHIAVVAYAAAELPSVHLDDLVRNFDRMRRTRNRAEYGLAIIGRRQLRADLRRAQGIVDLVEEATRPLES